MAEYIDRAEAQTALSFAFKRYMVAHETNGEGHVVWSDYLVNLHDAIKTLREVPAADVQEIVRCADCWKHDYDNCPIHEYSGMKTEDDFWCKYGERKDGDT